MNNTAMSFGNHILNSVDGGMLSSGLTFHPEKILSGERIERHTVVSDKYYYEIVLGITVSIRTFHTPKI